jgi:hypothetical protein
MQKRRKRVCSSEQRSEECRKELELLEQKLEECEGPRNILRHKVLCQQMEEKRAELQQIKDNHEERKIHALIQRIDELEKRPKPDRKQKVISTPNRLLPPSGKKQDLLSQQRDISDSWGIRAHKKRLALQFHRDIAGRKNVIDTCRDCGMDMVVDKDSARMVCPSGSCGAVQKFESHIFDVKDIERDESSQTRSQSLTHMQKFMAQFERGYPCASLSVLESLYIQYSKFHFHDPAKAQSCTTGKLMKNCTDIHRIFKRAPERVTKELKAEGVPEYSQEETAHILNQRNRLRLPDEIHDPGSKNKKSYCNQIYLRQSGNANDMPQSNLFTQAKTINIHLKRCRSLEKECQVQKDKQRRLGITSQSSHAQWNLRPWS